MPSPAATEVRHQPNLHLLPKDKFDEEAIAHLHTLSPSLWTPLIDLSHPYHPSQHPITTHSSLIDWTADMHWPIAQPICQLLLTLVNNAQNRERYGDVFVRAVTRVLEDVEEWDWVVGVVGCLVGGIEDREWMRGRFGVCLRGLEGRVPRGEWEGWGMGEVVGRCLDEAGEERRGGM